MAKIFITGSSDGLGFLAGKQLTAEGHEVVLHARNAVKKALIQQKIPNIEVVIGDLAVAADVDDLARQVNALGAFDAIIHNAGVYNVSAETIFRVNLLAPYMLTKRITKPKRLVYLSSNDHFFGKADFKGLRERKLSYSSSKLFITMFSNAFAKRFPEMYINAVDPGWVPTKMGGKGAPDDLYKGYQTQIWLATNNDRAAHVTGKYFFHKKQENPNPYSENEHYQNELLAICAELAGV